MVFTIKDGKAEVGNGIKTAISDETSGAIAIPVTLGGTPVASIGVKAFFCCSGLTSVTIPQGIEVIGEAGFYGCRNLESVTIPSSVKSVGRLAFYDCRELARVTISDGVTSIGDKAFYACETLESVTIPSSVRSVGEQAFDKCLGMKTLVISEGVTSIGTGAFADCGVTEVTIPSSVTNFGEGASFFECQKLSSVVISDGATSIAAGMFGVCTGLTSVTIPPSVTSIGGSAFSGCSALKSVAIPSGVTSIGDSAFSRCSALTSVTIPPSVTSIGDGAFSGCCALGAVVIPSSVLNVGKSAFDGCTNLVTVTIPSCVTRLSDVFSSACASIKEVIISDGVINVGQDAFTGCGGLTSVKMPSSVLRIEDGAFDDCSELVSVTIPACVEKMASVFPSAYSKIENVIIADGATRIGESAFDGCLRLLSVTIPLSVSSIDSYAFYGCKALKSVKIPPRVVNIGKYAFSNCSGLTTVTIPTNVMSVGDYAFLGCDGVKSVTVSGRFRMSDLFGDCTHITSVTITDGETVIGDYAFCDCSGLEMVTFPDSVTSIGEEAFQGCRNLTSVMIPSNVTNMGDYAFCGCVGLTKLTIPDSVMDIGHGVFLGCTGLSLMEIPSSVKSIGQFAFDGCSGLKSVTIPDGVMRIDEYAFSGCSALTSVSIPKSVESIGEGAFFNCEELVSVTIPGRFQLSKVFGGNCAGIKSVVIAEGETSVGDYAFAGCCNLLSIEIPSCVTNVGDYAFSNCAGLTSLRIPAGVACIGSHAFSGCTGLTSVVLPANVTNVGSCAFEGCDNMISVVVPGCLQLSEMFGKSCGRIVSVEVLEGETGIGSYAFSNCSGLISVTIPSSVMSIGEYAFSFCSRLESIVLPDGVMTIGSNAFEGCGSMISVTIPTSVTSIGDSAFCDCSGLTSVTVPPSVMSIGFAAFSGCSRLESMTLPFVGTRRGDSDDGSALFGHVFGNWMYAGAIVTKQRYLTSSKTYCIPSSLKTVTITDEDEISLGAFSGCNGLTTVKLSETVGRIASYAFEDCVGLTSAMIPSSVSSIGFSAYKGCLSLDRVDVTSLEEWLAVRFSDVEANPLHAGAALYVSGEKVTNLIIPEGTTEIGDCAFYGGQFTSVTIPRGVMNIASTAFGRCTHIDSAVICGSIPGLRSLFPDSCATMTTVRIAGCRLMGVGFFDDCVSLKNVYVTSLDDWMMTNIGNDPVENGATLYVNDIPVEVSYDELGFAHAGGWVIGYEDKDAASVAAPEGFKGVGRRAFADMPDLERVLLPSTLKYISEGAFANDTYLDDMVLPDSVEVIGAGAFENCSWMQTMTMGAGVRSVGDRAFAGCTKLAAAKFAEGLGEVGDAAFSTCWRMMSVSLPVSVSNVAATAFKDCASLTGVTVPTMIAPMSEWFAPVYRQIENVTVPKGTTEVCAEMFAGCAALKTVELPEGVTNIASGAFRDCVALETILLPESLGAIGDEAFAGCTALKAIVLPKNVAVLGKRVFSGCAALSDVTLSRALTAIPDGTFAGCDALDSFVVPESVAELGSRIVPSATTAIYYLGNAPAYAADVYAQANAALVSYVVDGTKGWDGRPTSRDLPQSWPMSNGRPIKTWSPPPDDPPVDPVEPVVTNTITYVNLQGAANTNVTMFTANDLPLALGPVELEGRRFLGWMPNGGVIPAGTVTNVAFTAMWEEIAGPSAAVYGPWSESEAVKNPDKLGPTMLTDMTLELNGAAGAVGDVVAAFRGDTGALCGLGKVMDESGTLSMACYAPTGVKLHFKVWVAASGVEDPDVVDCNATSDLTAPTSGAFLSGHALVVSDNKDLTISLGSADWHTVSFNVLPEDPSPAAVFGSVKAKIAAVTQGIEFWMPGKSSSLKAIEIGKGYWVNTKVDDVEWTVSGKTDPKVEIALEEGWNLIGYAPETEGAVLQVLKTALAAKAVDYVTYGVEFYPGGTLKKMEPGKAYWVHATKAYTLVYDEVGTQVKAARVLSAPRGEDAAGTALEPTYGPWDESEAVKNPDKLGPTFLTDMAVEIDGEPAAEGDVVAVFRGDSGTLCGLGKVMDDSGTLTVVCYAPKGVTLSFKVWLAESGMDEPVIVKCDKASKLVAPESGAFYDGHAISASTEESAETIVTGEKVTIETEFVGYKAVGLPSGLKYDAKTGKIAGAAKTATAAEGVVVKFTKKGAEDEELTIVVRAEEISAECEGLSSGPLPAGVAGAAGGMDIQVDSEGGTKSVSVTKLPSGMKYDSKSGKITGAPTKAGDYEVVLTVTTAYGNKETVKIPVSVAAMPVMAVGTFSGFVSVGEDNLGTFTLTATDAGKLTAKVVTAAGTVSFSGTCWDAVEDGVYRATLTTKKGEKLTLTLDSTAGWNENQLSGAFTTAVIAETKKTAAVPSRTYSVSAQRNAFGKTWYFAATGDETAGWKFAYTEDTKGAALTVTLKADGSTSIAGKLPNGTDAKGKAVTIKVSTSGYANVGGLKDGAILADFAPVLTVNKVKTVLAIKTNLWFDRSNDHAEGAGEARFVK